MKSIRPGRKRRWIVNALLAIPVLAGLAFVAGYEECDAECSDWDFVQDLLLADGWSVARRWAHNPSIAVDSGRPREIAMLGSAVYELNEILDGTGTALKFLPQGPADITVRFLSRAEYNADSPDFIMDHKIQGVAHMDFDNSTMQTGEIFVVRDMQESDQWGTLLHEIGHSIGIIGHTDRYLSSQYHVERGYGSFSGEFSADDKKALRFLYQHISPGASKDQVHAAFKKHWILRSR